MSTESICFLQYLFIYLHPREREMGTQEPTGNALLFLEGALPMSPYVDNMQKWVVFAIDRSKAVVQ